MHRQTFEANNIAFVKRRTIKEETIALGETVKVTWEKSKKAFGSTNRRGLSKTILSLKCPRLQIGFNKLYVSLNALKSKRTSQHHLESTQSEIPIQF